MTRLAMVSSGVEMDRLAGTQPSLLVTFTGPKCVICRRLAPMLEIVLEENAGALASAKVDAEASPELAERFEIRSLPTTLLFRNGALADRITGFATAGALRTWLQKNGVSAAA